MNIFKSVNMKARCTLGLNWGADVGKSRWCGGVLPGADPDRLTGDPEEDT